MQQNNILGPDFGDLAADQLKGQFVLRAHDARGMGAIQDEAIFARDGFGHSIAENRHGSHGKADFLVALDQLQASAPNVNAVSLVVAWHGTDLRCGNCTPPSGRP